MKRSNIITGIKILGNRLRGKPEPILVGWAVTNRCNLRCRYCAWPHRPAPEIDTQQALSLAVQMADAGVRQVVFSGGEPLLRDDLEQIIDQLKQRGITIGLDSNGLLVPQKKSLIRKLDALALSLDGPKENHDRLRGKGAFDAVTAAIETAQSEGIPVTINTTLTTENVDAVDWLLEFAEQHHTVVDFQPVSDVHTDPEDAAKLMIEPSGWHKIIDALAMRKQNGAPVMNSPACLAHLRHYPEQTSIGCTAGRIITRIDPQGMLFPCNPMRLHEPWPNAVELGFAEAFARMPKVACKQCWCSATVELNLIGSWNFSAIRNKIDLDR